MLTKLEHSSNGTRLHINDMATRYYADTPSLFENIDEGVELFRADRKVATLRLSQVGNYQIKYI